MLFEGELNLTVNVFVNSRKSTKFYFKRSIINILKREKMKYKMLSYKQRRQKDIGGKTMAMNRKQLQNMVVINPTM